MKWIETGKVTSAKVVATSFNESHKVQITTTKYFFVVYGLPTVKMYRLIR